MTHVLLVRHGQTSWTAERRLQGQVDVPLSDGGRAAVLRLLPLVRRLAPDHVVASPLRRATETARLLGYDGACQDQRWQEADLGAWTGQSSIALRADTAGDRDYLRWRGGQLTPPCGETFTDMTSRVAAALDQALDKGETVLVITHGGPIRTILASVLNLTPERLVAVAPASLTAVDVERAPGGALAGRLRSYNVTSHLESTDPPD